MCKKVFSGAVIFAFYVPRDTIWTTFFGKLQDFLIFITLGKIDQHCKLINSETKMVDNMKFWEKLYDPFFRI